MKSKRTIALLFISMLLILHPGIVNGQSSPPMLTGGIDLAVTAFDDALEFHPAGGLGANIGYRLTDQLSIGAAFLRSRTGQSLDLVGESREIGQTVTTFQSEFGISFLRTRLFDLQFKLGAGAMQISSEAIEISLGTLGVTTIPATERTYTLVSTGLSAERRLSDRLIAQLKPQLSLVKISGWQRNWRIQGGLGFVFF